MPSTLLAIARGAAQGFAKRKQDAEAKAERDLENTIRLSQIPGVSIEDATSPDPAATDATQPPAGSAPAQRTALDAARQVWKTIGSKPAGDSTDAGAPAIAPKSPADLVRTTSSGNVDPVSPPAPPKPPAAPATPRSVLEIGRNTLGGRENRIMLDQSQTAAGQQRRNAAAHQKLLAIDESVGEFDPSVDYQEEYRKYSRRKQVADAMVKTGQFTQEQADTYAKTGEDLSERSRKAALEQAKIDQAKRPKAPVPGTPEYYAMVRNVARIRASTSKSGSDPAKQKDRYVRSRMVQLMKSPGKDPDLNTPLPGMTREEAIAQAGDEWDAVVAADEGDGGTDGSDSSGAAPSPAASGSKKTPAAPQGPLSAKIKTLNDQYKAALDRGVDEDSAWKVYQDELTKIKAAGTSSAAAK
jgi:hypothetical protein